MTVGENIRYLRKQAHLTQKQLADLSGVHEVTIRGYETGKFNPKMENLTKLSTALKCNINDLLNIPPVSSGKKPIDSSRYGMIIDKINSGNPIDQSDLNFLCSDCIREYYDSLNPDGQKQANKMISDLLDALKLLPEIPQFQKGNSTGKSSGKDTEKGTK